VNSAIDMSATTQDELTENTFGSSDPIFRKERGEYPTQEEQQMWRDEYERRAKELHKGHFRQDPELALALREKYKPMTFGKMKVYDALRMLAECIDPTDTELYCVDQLVHTLQVANGMEEDGITDEALIVAALIHDLGKITELVGEKPEYVNGPNEPIGENEPGCGLDNAIFTWNHDEFAYQKLKDHVPDHVAWLLRYHSLRFDMSRDLMDDRDREYYEKYLGIFRKYDLGTKSIFRLPAKRLEDYREVIERHFPEEIDI
jgi:predicted HD phosphohydrolase